MHDVHDHNTEVLSEILICPISIASFVQIRASDMDFWTMGFENMQLRHNLKMYPPRVKMTVSMNSSDVAFKLPIKFNGCSDDSQLDIELTFPLGKKKS